MTLVFLAAALIQQPAPAFMRTPDIDGQRVAFVSEGDIWIGDLATGDAKRLTSDVGNEDTPRFSPDGASLCITGRYDGLREIYTIPAEGGPPKRLTYQYKFASVNDWTPDGKRVSYTNFGLPTPFQAFQVPAGGGVPTKLPLEFVSHITYEPSGKRVAFTRKLRTNMAWFHYIGGMQNQIWVGDFESKKFKQITNIAGTNEYPYWAGNGRIYFVNEREAKFTVMSVMPDGSGVRAVAGPYDVEVREMQGDAGRIIYEKGVGIEMVDLATGKPSPVSFRMNSDLIHTRPTSVAPQGYAIFSSITPSGKRVLVEARGQILSLPVGEGEARLWKVKDGVRFRYPVMSPDAKKVAYFSDETGEMALFVSDADGSNPKQLTRDPDGQLVNLKWSPDSKWIGLQDSKMRLRIVSAETGETKLVTQYALNWYGISYDFSPDSRWIAFAKPDDVTNYGRIYLYEVSSGNTSLIGNGRSDDTSLAFSKDGKFLAFLSVRNIQIANDRILNQLNTQDVVIPCLLSLSRETASPFAPKDQVEAPKPDADKKPEDAKQTDTKIDLDGLYDRMVEVPAPPGNYDRIAMTGNRILLAGDGRISYYDIAAKKGGAVTAGDGFELSSDGKKMLIANGGNLRVIDADGVDLPPTTGTVGFGGLSLTINPRAEWNQMFWDAWRLLRDYFYVANMHGNDWTAMGKKYAAYLPSVRSRNELDQLIRWMQSEIGSSHQYVGRGDEQNLKKMASGAFLGIDVAADSSGYYKISHIVRGDGFRTGERSPLLDPGLNVKEGMFLIEVAGVPARVGEDFLAGLVGRAGQVISVKVNDKPSTDGARTVLVKPVGSEDRMRYLDWVEANRQYVERASGGKIGYLHLAAMGEQDMSDFTKQYFAQRDKDALVVDVRFNNGGYVQDFINRILAEKLTGFFNMRNSSISWTRQGDYFLGPKACVMNEFNISCGEEFPHRFKDLKLGPLVGMRTMGGEVGSSPGWPLADGGQVYVPNYGMFTKDGWAIEGAGVSPDIEVPSDPNAFAAGKDPQLDAAVKYLLDELKRNPVVRPKPPADRVRVKGGL
jgi:tricorn protease